MASGNSIPKLSIAGAEPRIVASRVNQLIDRGVHDTEEFVVGTWLDDKPVYRKVLNLGSAPNLGSTSVAHAVASLGTVTSLRAVMDNATTQRPAPWGDGTIATAIEATDTNVTLETNWTAAGYATYAIMEYTKTTD